ncbi:hypothetical protein GLOIN_2v1769820 [Rhizophagus irregularis DAOM 181602=DAOM 197198]|nr:hypothetical protein GLOIN_2v1769820 [Rhizophagus irregularis DAOM 181602=DAOM 197198]
MSFKKHYRYFHIHWMLKQVEAGERTQDLKMSILQAIQYIIQDFPLDDHEVSDELANALKTLNFSDMMELKEFFNIPEENMKKLFKDQYSKDKAEPSHKLSDSKEDSEEDSEILKLKGSKSQAFGTFGTSVVGYVIMVSKTMKR